MSARKEFIVCPIKGLNCRAKKPRFVFVSVLKRQKKKGVCNSCKRGYTMAEAKKIVPTALKLRLDKRDRKQILVSCPLKKQNCLHLTPRWVDLNSCKYAAQVPGSCKSCRSEEMGYINKNGYREFSAGRHKPRVLEHRAVIEKALGRKLRKGETVHHINGKRADNREENLELRMSGNHPRGWSLRQMREYLKTVPKRLGGLK